MNRAATGSPPVISFMRDSGPPRLGRLPARPGERALAWTSRRRWSRTDRVLRSLHLAKDSHKLVSATVQVGKALRQRIFDYNQRGNGPRLCRPAPVSPTTGCGLDAPGILPSRSRRTREEHGRSAWPAYSSCSPSFTRLERRKMASNRFEAICFDHPP
jgi:hypothetical protein